MASLFQKIKKKPNKVRDPEKTLPIKQTQVVEEPPVQLPQTPERITVQPLQMITACGQSVGIQRDHNEDAIFTLTANLASDSHQIPFGLFIIADGMGGQQHGEIASSTAVQAVAETVLRKIYLPLIGLVSQTPEWSIQEVLLDSVHDAHRAIVKAAPGGGTTLTSALVIGEQVAIAHVGDSRLYVIHSDDSVEIVTRDHSLVKRLEELGQITAEEAAVHPQRNVLYRALGQGEPFDPDITLMQATPGASLLICSDGLWGLVPQEKMVSVVRTAGSPELACDQLVRLANDAGGPDNISVILVHLPV